MNYALNIIRNIEPKQYLYKDTIKQGMRNNYGFIAQDVFEYLPDSVIKITDYIPNIYCMCYIKNSNILQFEKFKTDDFSDKCDNIKLKLVDENDEELIVTMKEILNDNSILLNDELKKKTYFCFGKEVNDFHILEKNAIFTLTTAAVKKIDLELQYTKEIIVKQQNQIDNLTEELNNLKKIFLSHNIPN